jgi:hypothetical protein
VVRISVKANAINVDFGVTSQQSSYTGLFEINITPLIFSVDFI